MKRDRELGSGMREAVWIPNPVLRPVSAMVSRDVTIVNQLGLHARAAAKFVRLATRFDSQIRITRDNQAMDGKSIMGILLLAASRGVRLTISADGRDESAAVDALCQLVQSGFGEDSCSV